MLILQLLVTLATIVAIIAGIPQMLKLVQVKNSEEFNKATWALWVGTQSISLSYAVALGDTLLICVNATWVVFYTIMVGLIVYYDPKHLTLHRVPVTRDNRIRQSEGNE